MAWPHPVDGNLKCCDDYLPCFCYCADWDDYDATKKQREEMQREYDNFENASPEAKELYRLGKLRWADLARPTPPPVRHYARHMWRRSDRIEEVIDETCRDIARCDIGDRNNTLSRASYFLGKLVQSGSLDIEHAAYKLGQAARDAKLPLQEAATTVRLGLQAGMREEARNPYVGQTPVGRGATGTWKPAY